MTVPALLDPSRALWLFGAAVLAGAAHREVVDCDGSGYAMRPSCADRHGRVCCPICGRRVRATPAGRRAVVLARHQPRRAGGEAPDV